MVHLFRFSFVYIKYVHSSLYDPRSGLVLSLKCNFRWESNISSATYGCVTPSIGYLRLREKDEHIRTVENDRVSTVDFDFSVPLICIERYLELFLQPRCYILFIRRVTSVAAPLLEPRASADFGRFTLPVNGTSLPAQNIYVISTPISWNRRFWSQIG